MSDAPAATTPRPQRRSRVVDATAEAREAWEQGAMLGGADEPDLVEDLPLFAPPAHP